MIAATGVDPLSRREFWQILHELHPEGLAIVVSTPNMEEAEFATRVAFLHQAACWTSAPARRFSTGTR